MIPSSREKGFQHAKQEDGQRISSKAATASTGTTSSRQWSSSELSRNPRIVRVSRSFGGKDRHSKVCTIRGLRDRRIRLSVPTAIQLYDLQDRLGLSQPSKVIDWLLDATKDDIDHLPPLQIPQGLFDHQLHQQMMLQSSAATTNNDSIDHDHHRSKYPSLDLEASSSLMRASGIKGKEVDQRDDHHDNPMAPPHMINPYHMNWEPSSNLTLSSQFGSSPSSGNEYLLSQLHDHHHQNNSLLYSNNNNAAAAAAAAAASLSHSHHHHFFFCPPAAATMPSLFPTYAAAQQLHNNLVMPISSLSITSGSSQVLKPFSILNPLSNPDEDDDDHDDKEDT